MDPDPDPAFQVNPETDLDTDPDSYLIRIQGLMAKNWRKKYAQNFLYIFFDQKLQVIYP